MADQARLFGVCLIINIVNLFITGMQGVSSATAIQTMTTGSFGHLIAQITKVSTVGSWIAGALPFVVMVIAGISMAMNSGAMAGFMVGSVLLVFSSINTIFMLAGQLVSGLSLLTAIMIFAWQGMLLWLNWMLLRETIASVTPGKPE